MYAETAPEPRKSMIFCHSVCASRAAGPPSALCQLSASRVPAYPLRARTGQVVLE